MPFVSLGIAIAGALFMERTPARARIAAGVAVLGFAVLTGIARVLESTRDSEAMRPKAARFIVSWAGQLSVQQALYFSAPFYIAAHPTFVHVPFFAALSIALVCASYDPLFFALARHPARLLVLQAAAAWWALVAILPMLGLSLVAAHATTALATLVAVGLAARGVGEAWPKAALEGLVAGGFVVAGAPFVPPAPLALGSIAIGTEVSARELRGAGEAFSAPRALVCHTSVRAPLGLDDRLFHDWTVDGRSVQRVALDVIGGRESGFRTWSRWSAPERGRVRCELVTSLGQTLGSVTAKVTD